jgi:hypothetical protein
MLHDDLLHPLANIAHFFNLVPSLPGLAVRRLCRVGYGIVVRIAKRDDTSIWC